MSSPLRVLFVAPVEPWCRENGSSLITADLLDALSTTQHLELLPVFARRPPPGYERQPPERLEGVLLDIPGLPRWLSVAKATALWSSPLRHRFDNSLVTDRVLATVRDKSFAPDVVHVEHLPLVDVGIAVARALGRPLVYRAHNIESRLWARRLGLPRILSKPIVSHMERLEAAAIRSVDLTLCISEGDQHWALNRAQGSHVELLPCTLRLERYDEVERQSPHFDAQICFVGGLDWGPNEDGLRWFVANVLPEVTRLVPEAGLAVLARGAHERPWLTDNPSIRILRSESSAPRLFAASHVSIAPLFQGGGVRIKIPESLALECPVVATPIGAEGHDLPGVTQTEEPVAFAQACARYLQDRKGIEEPLRPDVQTRYGADRQAARLVGLWTSLVDETLPQARAPNLE